MARLNAHRLEAIMKGTRHPNIDRDKLAGEAITELEVAPAAEAGMREVPVGISVTVPWETLEMGEAQQWYAKLRAEFERAGSVLNARLCAQTLDSFTCFMAGTEGACKPGVVHKGRPAGIDYAHKNPKTGLLEPAMICSERCWILYQGTLIRERREKELAAQV